MKSNSSSVNKSSLQLTAGLNCTIKPLDLHLACADQDLLRQRRKQATDKPQPVV